ncbi:MAG: beta-galactosidase [Bacteroidetes bacterium OLB9]|nr:MAG: beta-galactosidase [Bacteroidetes bacterium OLB9]
MKIHINIFNAKMNTIKLWSMYMFTLLISVSGFGQRTKFNNGWSFKLDTSNIWNERSLVMQQWRSVTLPHDWSIELPFDSLSPSGHRGASLRGGLGLYEKRFKLSDNDADKKIFIIFDGVYMNSTVIINGHTLGTRPFGYISFEYDLTPFLRFDGSYNVLKVRVENRQPNSRWYSGSGIYRNVWLDKRGSTYIKSSGTFIASEIVNMDEAKIHFETELVSDVYMQVSLTTEIFDHNDNIIDSRTQQIEPFSGLYKVKQDFVLSQPKLWDIDDPNLYTAIQTVWLGDSVIHTYSTRFGVRNFYFDQAKGFFLNGRHVKIIGANMHHDLGALGAAVNVNAMRRQLKMLKEMGFNGIRTAHNPPAPEWLDLCDELGFIVMNETFDVWREVKENTTFNYNLYFDEWFERDLRDHVIRDRNHPSVFMWSIGNEIPEQSSKGPFAIETARKMAAIIRGLDTTRVITAGLNYADNSNQIYQSGALDVIGVNYNHRRWQDLGKTLFPGDKPFILAESVSALASRGAYDMPSDSIRRWSGFTTENRGGNPDYTCSAYENCSAPWASTSEEALQIFLKYPFLSGMFMWTGFDYLGEPTPYPFPARSSYFGAIDLAGFPKDAYYLYKSVFSKDTVLHILPHWNWVQGQKIDVHVYFNHADAVALYLNDKLIGRKEKTGDELFVRFNNITYQPGSLKAVSEIHRSKVAEMTVKTAGKPYRLIASADRKTIIGDGEDLCFVTVKVLDKEGNLVPNADNLLHFQVRGAGKIEALDNGCQTDLTPFSNKEKRKAFNGLALAIIRPDQSNGVIELNVNADGLLPATIYINVE